LGVDEKVVRGVFARYSETHIKELEIKAGRWLGMDELYLLGKHRCILTNIGDRTVIDLLKVRHLQPVATYLKNLKDNRLIEHTCIDMWDPHRIANKEALPKVDFVTDKFHLLKETNKCMKTIRLHYQRNMKGYARDVFRNRFLFDRRAASHTDKDKEKLETWRAICPDLVDAFWTKEKFFQIYDCETKTDARKAYQAWVDELPLFVHKAFKPLMNTVVNWETEIFNYFDRRITNNYTECMNGIAKMANRKGRGYSFKVIRFKLLSGYNATRVHVGSARAILTLAEKFGIEISTSGDVLIPEQV
jgi:transposase